MRKAVWFAGLLALAACNTPFDNKLPPASLAGGWSGSLSSAGTSLGTLQMLLVPSSADAPPGPGGVGRWTVAGSWSMSVASGADSGAVSGTGSDGSFSMNFTLHGAGDCIVDLSGAEFGGSSILGHYAASSCLLPDTGSFNVRKQ
jgi:hypothetical protein